MQVNCEIIKDLLPLYHDDVCSQESKKLVEETSENMSKVSGRTSTNGLRAESGKFD